MEHALNDRILLVEDDVALARLVQEYFESHGAVIDVARAAVGAMKSFALFRPDLAIVDVGLPGTDGFVLTRTLRSQSSLPIIILTARHDERDRVSGLEAGADDYVVKPFSAKELLLRSKNLLARSRGLVGPQKVTVRVGGLELLREQRSGTLDGRSLELTSYEFDLLFALVENAGKTMPREALVHRVRGRPDEVFERSVDVHISRLRIKLGDDARAPQMIKTVRGVGYILTIPA